MSFHTIVLGVTFKGEAAHSPNFSPVIGPAPVPSLRQIQLCVRHTTVDVASSYPIVRPSRAIYPSHHSIRSPSLAHCLSLPSFSLLKCLSLIAFQVRIRPSRRPQEHPLLPKSYQARILPCKTSNRLLSNQSSVNQSRERSMCLLTFITSPLPTLLAHIIFSREGLRFSAAT